MTPMTMFRRDNIWSTVQILLGHCDASETKQADASEASALQGAAAQDAQPAFDLIEPGAVGWG
jgi:hypothetical protein